MHRADRRGPVLAATTGLAAVLLVAVAVPTTDSAFSSSVGGDADAAAKARFTCADEFAGQPRHARAYFEYAFADPAASASAADSSAAGNTGRYEGARAEDAGAPIACPADAGSAYRLDGSSSRVTTSVSDGPVVSGFSEEVWFAASSPGKLLGYEIERSGDSTNYDKHLYVDTSGRLVYGLDGNGVQTIRTSSSVVDGTWHHVAATTSSTDGSVLYLDGRRVAADPTMTAGETFPGYWRIGQGKLLGWPDHPDSTWFTGSLRFAAAYPFVLTAQEVAAEAAIGSPGNPVTPADASTSTPSTPMPLAPDGTAEAVTPAPATTATTGASSGPAAAPTTSAQPAPAASATGGTGDDPVTTPTSTPTPSAEAGAADAGAAGTR